MIFITKYEPPKEIYESLYNFAISNFNIQYNKGEISIDNYTSTISYGNSYTKEEAIKDFIGSRWFKDYCRSRHYNLYEIKAL